MISPHSVSVRDRTVTAGLADVTRLDAAELANAATHGIGLVFSVVGSVALISRVLAHGDAWRITGCAVFAATLITMYAASKLSHCSVKPQRRHLFRRLDQGSIYLLIAGTYTPFGLAYLDTGWWWLLFGTIWIVALCGCFSKFLLSHRVDAAAVWIYILLGWLPIVSIYWLVAALPAVVLWWIIAGGLCYTIGTVFLGCDGRWPYFHAVWHLFVMAGSTCHFVAVFDYVAS